MLNDASRIINVINKVIDQKLKSGAGIDITYGQVHSISGTECSVYIAGSREVAETYGEGSIPTSGFRIPGSIAVHPNDFVKVSIDSRGHRWIEDVIPTTTYPKAILDSTGGAILLGDGTTAPVAGQPGQVIRVNQSGIGMEFETPNDLVFIPFVYKDPGANISNVEMLAFDSDNTANPSRITVPWSFEVVGITIRVAVARTTGTLTATVFLGGVASAVSAVIDGTNTTFMTGVGSEANPINKGTGGPGSSGISIAITTSGFAPTTNFVYGGVWALVHRTKLVPTTPTGSFTADAVLRELPGTTFTADAIIKRVGVAFTFTADAVLQDPPVSVIAEDDYSVNQSGNWGTADEGGAWTSSSAPDTDVV